MPLDAVPWFYVVVFRDIEVAEVRRFPTYAACQRSQRAAEEAMRALWGVSLCGRQP